MAQKNAKCLWNLSIIINFVPHYIAPKRHVVFFDASINILFDFL